MGFQLSSATSGISLGSWFFTQFHETNVLDNWQVVVLPQSGGNEFIPPGSTIIYQFLCGFINISLCQSIQIDISPEPVCSSKLTHTGVEIDTCEFHTGCELSSAASAISLGLCFLTQFLWHEMNVLVVLPQSGGSEFDPAGSTKIYHFLCGFIWVSLCWSIKIKPPNIYIYISPTITASGNGVSPVCCQATTWINVNLLSVGSLGTYLGNLNQHIKISQFKNVNIDGLVQDCSNSIANALELLQSCTKPSACGLLYSTCNPNKTLECWKLHPENPCSIWLVLVLSGQQGACIHQ